MPLDSPEMVAIVIDMQWLGRGIPVGERVPGDGLITDQQAIDVAAFINDDEAHMRPTSEEGKVEYPHPEDKPVDYHKGPFADPWDDATHKFGPWAELRSWREEHGQYTGW